MKRPAWALAGGIALLWASILLVSSLLDLGDAEALYAVYAQHPQSSYLDHPPLIGLLLRVPITLFGAGTVSVRLVPMLCAALCLILAFLITRDLFGHSAAALCVGLMIASPVFSIGMTAASPDAPLAVLTLLFVRLFYRSLNPENDGTVKRQLFPLLSGIVLGFAFLAKYTGACLALGAVIVLLLPENRRHLRRPILYLAATVALAIASPVLWWNAHHDWIGVTHRLVYTQTEAGFSLRNLGALLGGQLLYVGPLVLVLFAVAIRRALTRRDRTSPRARAERLLMILSASVLAPAYLLVLWSKTAEPHWPAAGYLPLFPLTAFAIAELIREGGTRIKGLYRWAVGVGVAVLVIAHIAVLTPVVPLLTPAGDYEPKYDLSNELRGFPAVAATIRRIDSQQRPVTAAFYTLCSQLAFHLSRPDDPRVRCVSPALDDFDLWYGPFTLDERGALFVTDNRFDHDPKALFPDGTVTDINIVPIFRAGIEVRRFSIYTVQLKTAGE